MEISDIEMVTMMTMIMNKVQSLNSHPVQKGSKWNEMKR